MALREEEYRSPLVDRYATAEMSAVFSPIRRARIWRRLWLALAEGQHALGLPVAETQLRELREHLDDVELKTVREQERRTRHEVVAHIQAWARQCPGAAPIIHLGATSAFVMDNGDLIQLAEALRIIRKRLVATIRALAGFAEKWKATPTLGYTHLQVAQVTTVGKRACLWLQDLIDDLETLDWTLPRLPFRGLKGAVGTQASFLTLFKGDGAKVEELERRVASEMGFSQVAPVGGQTYSRKWDQRVGSVLTGIAISAQKFSNDLRMLQAFGEMEEPLGREQVGSSAMAYKRNPMRCERIAGLARLVLHHELNLSHTAAAQFLERTLDDSSNRRLAIPEAFLATEAILRLLHGIAEGMRVCESRIQARLNEQLPFLVSEELLMRGVLAGGDRQALHEIIRRHSMDISLSAGEERARDLLDRLAGEEAFAALRDEFRALQDPSTLAGLAPRQTERFLRERVALLLAECAEETDRPDEVEV